MASTNTRELIRRLATSNEPDPVRRVLAEMAKDPDLVAEAVLELVTTYFAHDVNKTRAAR